MHPTPSIANLDFPALFNAADQASLSAQNKYLLLVRADLTILVVSALMSSWNPSGGDPLAVPSAVLVAVGIFMTYQLSSSTLERVWFDGRAIAESVKSLTWRYMTASEPFPTSLTNQELDQKFLEQIDIVLNERKEIAGELSSGASGTQISDKMRQIRSLSPIESRDIYLEYRIKDQRNWYSSKAKYNRKARAKWFNAMIVAQTFSLISAILHAVWVNVPVNTTGFFAALATAFLSWLQLKKHQELSQSYALAAQELSSVESLSRHVNTEESLAKFVSQAEDIISREHTLWVVKRSS